MTTLAGQGWRCVAVDRRGHGRSDEPGRGYDFDTLAGDVSAVIEKLDLRDVLLVGHSMGAAEVVRYLTRYRSRRVSRAVLVAPTTPFTMRTDDNPEGATRDALEKLRQNLAGDFHRQVARAAPDFFGTPVPAEVMDWWTRMIIDRCPLKVLLDLHKVMTETDFRAELRTMTTPTLILHGDRDKSAQLELTGRQTAQLIPGSRLVVYEGAAHGLPFTHREQLLSDIAAFAR
jgi:pimeloyl-ACP methyl ester carboxylesterase